jgi:hypothetical protein
MNSNHEYKKGDSIVYVGFVISANKKQKIVHFATVIEVGIHELILEPQHNYFSKHLKVSKYLCLPLNLNDIMIKRKTMPGIGDLVMSYCKKFGDEEYKKEIGHLHEIEIRPGKDNLGKVLIGLKLKSFNLDDLIIMQKK